MASGGSSRLSKRRQRLAIFFLFGLATPGLALADEPRIAVPADTLDRALTTLARQSGTDIISTESGLARVRVRGVTGQMSPREALRRLLEDTEYRAVPVDGTSYRIVRARRAVPRPAPRPAPAPAGDREDIIVTASKQHSTLLRFPGSAILVGGFAPGTLTGRTIDLDEVARSTPVLQNTELGVGRNKIFIRGIADSSFNGATQSTASLYFDEVPLGYAGPEPSLNLYDMKSVEILEGPQGTLYGAGAIGGIIRLTPNPVDLTRYAGSISGGGTITKGGEPGFDLAAMANVPILGDRVGLRVVGYRDRDGGFIDDSLRRVSDVNRTDTVGGRIALAVDPGNGWSVEVGGLAQRIDAADAQYAETIVGPLTRRSRLAQPYSSDIKLLRAVVRKRWDSGLELLSASGYVDLNTADTFDATSAIGSVGPTVYTNSQSNELIVEEVRLSRAVPGKLGWVVGASFLHDRDIQARTLGPPGNPAEIIGVTNMTDSFSAFGEATWPVTPRLSITLGARGTSARTDGEPSAQPRNASFIQGRATKRVDPTFAVSWLVANRTALFARFQTGYRTGGLAVATGIGRVADFRSDSILVGEVGLRKQRIGATGLDLTTAVSYAHWRDIQADLYNRRGQPFTANIGNADIVGLEAAGDWVPVRGVHATFAFLYTYNLVEGPLAQSSVRANRRLPETPPFAGTAGLSYRWAHGATSVFSVGVSGNYVGRSVLGTGDFLDVSQGQYATVGTRIGWQHRNLEVALSGENLLDASANRFSLGNPTTLTLRQQTTPLRPRTWHLGITISL